MEKEVLKNQVKEQIIQYWKKRDDTYIQHQLNIRPDEAYYLRNYFKANNIDAILKNINAYQLLQIMK